MGCGFIYKIKLEVFEVIDRVFFINIIILWKILICIKINLLWNVYEGDV